MLYCGASIEDIKEPLDYIYKEYCLDEDGKPHR
jgi:hypothetical protein